MASAKWWSFVCLSLLYQLISLSPLYMFSLITLINGFLIAQCCKVIVRMLPEYYGATMFSLFYNPVSLDLCYADSVHVLHMNWSWCDGQLFGYYITKDIGVIPNLAWIYKLQNTLYLSLDISTLEVNTSSLVYVHCQQIVYSMVYHVYIPLQQCIHVQYKAELLLEIWKQWQKTVKYSKKPKRRKKKRIEKWGAKKYK